MTTVLEIPLCSYEEIENGYGTIIGPSSAQKTQGLTIPFYSSSVIEGKNFNFECRPPVTCRTAEIRLKANREVLWLERHMHLTQLFIGLGGKESFLMILGKPTHDRKDLRDENRSLPDLTDVKAFIIPPGYGVMLHLGTWHDFPVSLGNPVTILTFNSEEVVEALAAMKSPDEMLGQGDVYKIDIRKRLGVRIMYNWKQTAFDKENMENID